MTDTKTKTSRNGDSAVQDPAIKVQELPSKTILVPLLGTTPLIMHRFTEKAKRQMLEKMQGIKRTRETRDPSAEYEGSMHRLEAGGYGFPSTGFKMATVSAARFYGSDVTMVALKQSMFFHGEPGVGGSTLTEIVGEPEMREDVVRLNRNATDLRYRAQFREWSATLKVSYITTQLDEGSVLSLIDAGGLGVGIGDWRPERSGEYGTYKINPDLPVERVG